MLAAIQETGGALMILNAAFEASWVVLLKNGTPLRFTHATGNRLVVKWLIKRHPADCRDIRVVRFIPTDEAPPTDEEIEAEMRREATKQTALEKERVKKANARLSEGRLRYQRKGPRLTEEEQRKRHNEYLRRDRARKAAAALRKLPC
jgi:hypothetical protein